jgi:integrase
MTQATAAHKILWIETFVERGVRHATLRELVRVIRLLGAGAASEIAQQHQLVLAYLYELKNSPRLTLPTEPSPAMPKTVFRRFIATFTRNYLFTLRIRTIFLLVWRTGLSIISIIRLRRGAVELRGRGVYLTWTPGHSRQTRRKFIPLHRDPELCLVRSLAKWISESNMPDDPNVFFFPAIGKRGMKRDWHQPFACANASVCLALRNGLRKIRASRHGYNLTSLRRTHAVRCRDSLGSAMAAYQTGFASQRSLSWMLRAEPDWEQVPKSVLEAADSRAQLG